MAQITLAEIENGLDTLLKGVQTLAPLAALGGPAAAAIGVLVGDAAAAGDAILTAVENDEAIIAGGDVSKIEALQKALQAQNALLTQQAEQA